MPLNDCMIEYLVRTIKSLLNNETKLTAGHGKPLKRFKGFTFFLLTHDLSRGLIKRRIISRNRFNSFTFTTHLGGQLEL